MKPLLTIAIPTYNRSGYLRTGLQQLANQLSTVPAGEVEVIVSDNCSPDDTGEVVKALTSDIMPIRYIRNENNLGWAPNFAQCFEMARGRYILMIGDDDLLVDGALSHVLDTLRAGDYGVLFLRPYGFDNDFRAELPASSGREYLFRDPDKFLIRINRWFNLTSAYILNKEALAGVDAREFVTTDLATFHLFLRAALAGKPNLFVDKFLIATKRQNSFSYRFADVFVTQLWRIVDAHKAHGLKPATIAALEWRKMFSYYPFYLFDLRTTEREDVSLTYQRFSERFRGRLLFHVWLAPTLLWPKPAAVAWGAMTTAVGRVAAGDLRRGLAFMKNRLQRVVSGWGTA
jgi:glycosyltransferase involved in cell wall biosynthesis